MRRIAVINQKGGVGKTTTAANLAAALAEQARRVVVIDMDPQANLSLHLDRLAESGSPSAYRVLTGSCTFKEAIRTTDTANLSIVPSNIDLSGAETELASAMGREAILGEAIDVWVEAERAATGSHPADYIIFDCPPSLGLLALNALSAAGEVLLTVQTEFLALQGMSQLVEIVQLVQKRLNPALVITGILPCMYDTRLRLAREVLAEIRSYFPGRVFKNPVGTNVKLAEAPSYGQTIFQYAPESKGAVDYRLAALEVISEEGRDPELMKLPRPETKEKSRAPMPPKAKKPAPSKALAPKKVAESTPAKKDEELREEVIKPEPPTKKKPARTAPEPTPPTVEPRAIEPRGSEARGDEPRRESKPEPTPPAPPKPAAPTSGAPAPRREAQIVRAKDLPPLPHDAFDNYLDGVNGF